MKFKIIALLSVLGISSYANSNNTSWVALDRCKMEIKPGADVSRCDLRGRNLTAKDLSNVNFSYADLDGVSFARSIIAGANFSHAKNINKNSLEDVLQNQINGVNLSYTDLSGVNFSRSQLHNTNLEGAILYNTKWYRAEYGTRADLKDIILKNAKLQKRFTKSSLEGLSYLTQSAQDKDLSGVELSDANFNNANLSGFNFEGADLEGVNWTGAKVTGVNFYRARVNCADLAKANKSFVKINLQGVDCSNVNLSSADFTDANLQGVKLYNSNVTNVNWKNALVQGIHLTKEHQTGIQINYQDFFSKIKYNDATKIELAYTQINNIADNIPINFSQANLTKTTLKLDYSNKNVSFRNANLTNSWLLGGWPHWEFQFAGAKTDGTFIQGLGHCSKPLRCK